MSKLIYGYGDKKSKICFIGEAPGYQEEKLGMPFVGPAGNLLDSLLSSVGIIRSQCYITNVIKEKPNNNDITQFINLSRKEPVITPAYMDYLSLLKEELSECRANVFVPLGNVPMFALTGLRGITKYRGSILESTLLPSKKVIPIIHPSAALRQYLYTYFISHDLKRVLTQSKFAHIDKPKVDLILRPTYNECLDFLKECKESKMVALDIEVTNEEVSCISFAYRPGEAMSIPFVEKRRNYFIPPQEEQIWLLIEDICHDNNIVKLGQNITFDATFLFRKFGLRISPVYDTMVGQAIIAPQFPKDLGFITSIYTHVPYYKDEGKRRIKSGGGTDMEFWGYNAKDSLVLMDAFPKIKNDIKILGNTKTFMLHTKIIEPLIFMSEYGILMDVDGIKQERAKVTKEITALNKELQDICGFPINYASPKQLKAYFYITKNIKPYIYKGKPTTDGNALKRLARKGYKEASIILKLRGLGKYLNTYLNTKVDKDNRMRCSYNPVGTTSGRLSSSMTIFKTGMNQQNQPKRMKRFMLADPGFVLYELDLGQAENRVVAYLGNEAAMIDCFETGQDVHSLTASLMTGFSPEEIKQQDKDQVFCDIGDGLHTWRYWGKKANHGLNYGEGYKTFALSNEITEAEGKLIVDRYHSIYPGVRRYQRMVQEQLSHGMAVRGIFGRVRIFHDRWGNELFKSAYSYIPQNAVSEIINRQGICYLYYTPERFKSVYILNQVHDSIGFQIPLSAGWDYHKRVLQDLKVSLEKPIEWRDKKFVIPVDFKMGTTFANGVKITMDSNLNEVYASLQNGTKHE